ncbi:FBD-associated F-box protein At4g10400 isoform X1 [Medicago truncatula]|uniref:FBD-associated F-box protein At4g10400 isoform X1 n=1 Tax=Medicago truncatula TaxID=3880 RepID=UPI000D2F47C4|nr:FBD-associated F-box protein At4g10400 isoform X1 [Medicago truncatula]
MARRKSAKDRLSSLPDSLLCHIMSFLPTRTSVATMTLVSRRWRYLWKYLQVFNFSDESLCYRTVSDELFRKFAFFVNAVLALRKARDIQKFNLTITYPFGGMFLLDCIQLWIHAATGPHLQELSLTVKDSAITLPPFFLLNCTNLVSLRLECEVHINEHSAFHFPSLKMLYIDLGVMISEVALLSGCPSLEIFDGYFCCDPPDYVTKLLIPPSSRSKRSKSTTDNFTWSWSYLNVRGNTELGIIGHFHSMMEAFLDVFSPVESEFVDPILKHLRDHKEYMNLLSCHSTSKSPLHATVLNYPEFRNLLHLKFILPCFNSNVLVNVLEKCQMLQVLIIQSKKEKLSPLRTWQPESTTVPECLKSHLTYIHIEGYQGFEDELTFAEYLLRNGLVLQTMLIFVDTSMHTTNKYLSVKRLTDIPRGSVTCQLKFDPAVRY